VLPIGGVKEKVLAALRAGIGTVLLPARNRRDLEDIPADARDKLQIVWVEHVDDAIAAALSTAAGRSRRRPDAFCALPSGAGAREIGDGLARGGRVPQRRDTHAHLPPPIGALRVRAGKVERRGLAGEVVA
jgi:hypothetical protein